MKAKKYTPYLSLCALLFTIILIDKACAAPLFARNVFEEPGTSATVSASPLAKSLRGGPLSILFIGSQKSAGRIAAEMPARFDCSVKVFMTESRQTLVPEGGNEFVDAISGRLRAALSVDYDVFWLDFDIVSLPPDLLAILSSHLEQGAGLVYSGPVKDLGALKDSDKIDYDTLRAMSYKNVKAEFEGIHGAGRLVSIPPLETMSRFIDRQDYFAVSVNSILFASGRTMGVTVRPFPQAKKFNFESIAYMNYRVEIINDGNPVKTDVYIMYRDFTGQIVFTDKQTYNVKSDKTFIALEHPGLERGDYSLEISLAADGEVFALAGGSLEIGSEQSVTLINSIAPYIEADGVIAGFVRISEDLKETMVIAADIVDSRGRELGREILDTVDGRISAQYSFLVKDPRDSIMSVRALFFKSDELVHTFPRSFPIHLDYRAGRFLFVAELDRDNRIYDDTAISILRDNGVGAITVDVADMLENGDVFARTAVMAKQSTAVIPVVDVDAITRLYSAADAKPFGENAHAILDTLASFNPERIVVKGQPSTNPIVDQVLQSFSVESREHPLPFASYNGGSLAVATNDSGNDESIPTVTSLYDDVSTLAALTGAAVKDANYLTITNEMKHNASKETLELIPWYALFHGMKGVWWEEGEDFGDQLLTPVLSPSPVTESVLGSVREISSGIDMLFTKSDKIDGDLLAMPSASAAETFSYRNGKSCYVGIVPAQANGQVGSNAVELRLDPSLGVMSVYDVRVGEFLGAVSSFSKNLSTDNAHVLAMLPYRVRNISLSSGSSVVKAGGVIDYSLRVSADKINVPVERHIVRVEVFGPGGEDMSFLGGVYEAPQGVFNGHIRTAINDAPGRWKIVATDIISGKTAERTVMVMGSFSRK